MIANDRKELIRTLYISWAGARRQAATRFHPHLLSFHLKCVLPCMIITP